MGGQSPVTALVPSWVNAPVSGMPGDGLTMTLQGLGIVRGRISRVLDGGFAVAFEIVLEAADADRLVAGYEVVIPPSRQAI